METSHYQLTEEIKQKTEEFLYSYPSLFNYANDNLDIIDNLRSEGIQQKSKDIMINEGRGSLKHTSEFESLEGIEQQSEKTCNKLLKIQRILNHIRYLDIEIYDSACYFKIIELYYFEKQTYQEIAKELNISKTTINEHKQRLIHKIAINIFGRI